jgi:hypothetical protein
MGHACPDFTLSGPLLAAGDEAATHETLHPCASRKSGEIRRATWRGVAVLPLSNGKVGLRYQE